MGYRSKDRDGLDRWRRQNAYRLIQSGLPDDAVHDHRRFLFVVREGLDPSWSGGTGWTIDWIDDGQAADLLELLRDGFPDARGWHLVEQLERRTGLPNNDVAD